MQVGTPVYTAGSPLGPARPCHKASWTEKAGAQVLTPGADQVIVQGRCWLLAALNTGVMGT